LSAGAIFICQSKVTGVMDIKYDKIGTGYNSTRKADPYLTEKLIYYLHPERD
jgi:hypothetical protein